MDNRDELQIIERIRQGETNQFSYLLNRYSNVIYSLIARIIPSKEDAEELTQDTFLKAFRKLDTFKGDCSFSTWLFRIAYNTAVSATRKSKIVFPLIDETMLARVADEEADAVFEEENEELLRKLEIALEKLNLEERALITLYYTEDKPVAEIAAIMELTADNVKIKLFRIRKKLYVLINKQQAQ
ncbi:sigma-70 family RNA polymerase sigma factor [Paludibacter sp.]|uniref:RNA polymerase sigma factor n=1 Tax=Paludibacter sp. TaxID=1898105 RepID=UPI00135522D1|nr:sigma-70 family RNA polymerase sigma factor [Paludibacter sp.]MTK52208.1 sigma-70 family RNA polymerase sigma factor [Paludibacter sp.]